jgi:hypothetical protein
MMQGRGHDSFLPRARGMITHLPPRAPVAHDPLQEATTISSIISAKQSSASSLASRSVSRGHAAATSAATWCTADSTRRVEQAQ